MLQLEGSGSRTYYHLTDAQVMLLWEEAFASKRKDDPPCNILFFTFSVTGGDPQAMTWAYQQLLTQNDSLRLQLTRLRLRQWREMIHDYPYIDTLLFRLWLLGVRQFISEPPVPAASLPLRQFADKAALDAYLDQLSLQSMRLVGGSLCFAEIARVGKESLVLIIRYHHIVADGYSHNLFLARLAEYYEQYWQTDEAQARILQSGSAVAGSTDKARVDAVPASVNTTAGAGRFRKQGAGSIIPVINQDVQYRQSPQLAKDLDFWKNTYRNQPHFSFPAGRTPLTSPFDIVDFEITGQLYQDCRGLAAENGCSLFGLLMTIAAFTVYRLTGRTNFVIFTMSHGRFDLQGKRTIGNLINMLPIFYLLEPGQTLGAQIQACHVRYLECLRHGRLPFNELMKLNMKLAFRHGFNFNLGWIVMSSLEHSPLQENPVYSAGYVDAKNQPHQFFVEIMDMPGTSALVRLKYQTVKHTPQQAAGYMEQFADTLARTVHTPDLQLETLR